MDKFRLPLVYDSFLLSIETVPMSSSCSCPASKRALDVVGASLLLVGLAPVLGLVALCIWLDDGRPLLFTQTRAGCQGDPFRIFKFRTLTHEPEDPTRPSAHTTRIGGLLRRWALDELPQLWNVLRGEMSLVGPRPLLMRYLPYYTEEEQLRHQVPPGITGWAQIHGRNKLDWDTRLACDVWYVRHRSLVLDARILWKTARIVFMGQDVADISETVQNDLDEEREPKQAQSETLSDPTTTR
jgi:lipopolysaccharide/colanic/teichoic acid biosynthesis glycosyltransferase